MSTSRRSFLAAAAAGLILPAAEANAGIFSRLRCRKPLRRRRFCHEQGGERSYCAGGTICLVNLDTTFEDGSGNCVARIFTAHLCHGDGNHDVITYDELSEAASGLAAAMRSRGLEPR